MRRARFAFLIAMCVACKGPADSARGPDTKQAPPMTDLDPKSPAAWMQAEAIAATAAKGTLKKRSDALPFLFTAESPPAVLIHRGAVVRDKGPRVAGDYLRDLGIIEGRGPQLDDVLFVLGALDARPP